MSIRIDTRPLGALIERLRTAPARIQEAGQAVLKDESGALAARVESRWPVDTGYSRPLWKPIKLTPWQWIVSNRANYARYVFAKGDASRTPLLDTWIAAEIARSRATLLVDLRSVLIAALRVGAKRGVAGGRITMGAR